MPPRLFTIDAAGSIVHWDRHDPDHPQKIGSFVKMPPDTGIPLIVRLSGDGRLLAASSNAYQAQSTTTVFDVGQPDHPLQVLDGSPAAFESDNTTLALTVGTQVVFKDARSGRDSRPPLDRSDRAKRGCHQSRRHTNGRGRRSTEHQGLRPWYRTGDLSTEYRCNCSRVPPGRAAAHQRPGSQRHLEGRRDCRSPVQDAGRCTRRESRRRGTCATAGACGRSTSRRRPRQFPFRFLGCRQRRTARRLRAGRCQVGRRQSRRAARGSRATRRVSRVARSGVRSTGRLPPQ